MRTGCLVEFLDDHRVAPPAPCLTFRARPVRVPRGFLEGFVDPQQHARARRARARLDALRDVMGTYGFIDTAQLVLDRRGRAMLGDGHHRLVVAAELAIETVPVRMDVVDHINGWGRPLADALPGLIGDLAR